MIYGLQNSSCQLLFLLLTPATHMSTIFSSLLQILPMFQDSTHILQVSKKASIHRASGNQVSYSSNPPEHCQYFLSLYLSKFMLYHICNIFSHMRLKRNSVDKKQRFIIFDLFTVLFVAFYQTVSIWYLLVEVNGTERIYPPTIYSTNIYWISSMGQAQS